MLVDFVEIEIVGKKGGVIVPIRQVISFSISTGRTLRASRATVSLVRKKLLKFLPILERESEIIIRACYKDRYPPTELFHGVIEDKPLVKDRIELKAMDFSYFFKEIISTTFKEMSDMDIAKKIIPSDIDTTNVSNMQTYEKKRFAYKSVRWIIDFLSKKSVADYFLIGKKLYYGRKYELVSQKKTETIDLDSGNVTENNLQYYAGEGDIKVIVRGTDAKGEEVFTGTAGGGSIEREFFEGNTTSSGVNDKAEKLYNELSFTGFKGDFKMFLEPVFYHSHKVNLIDKEDNESACYIDKVDYTFSQSDGLKQLLYMGEVAK